MLEKVNGEGQGCCLACLIERGWSCEWSSMLYYIKNSKGVYLRVLPYGYLVRTGFDSDSELRRAAFCYRHALLIEDARKILTDW